jgi:uncharacterized membrane protein YdjX (TVP38/TMEM64 family)
MTESTTDGIERSFPWKWVIAAIVIVGLGVLRVYLPIGEWLESFNVWVSGLGPKGMVVYVGVYVLATILFLPGSVITVGAGFLFGVVRGTLVVSAGSTIGASLAFLISRYLATQWVAEKAGASPRFKAIDRAIGSQGWKIVGLLRLSPAIPFNLSNYLYGLTSVRFVPYVIASWLGMLPGTVMYVYLGTAGRAGLDAAAGVTVRSWQQDALLGVGLVATIAVTILITRIAKNALKEAELKEADLEEGVS